MMVAGGDHPQTMIPAVSYQDRRVPSDQTIIKHI